MSWTNNRRVLTACFTAACLLAAPSRSSAACALWDWMFGHGQTSYAPPYTPPVVCAPAAAPACGCAPVQCAPACQSCTPTATYRISYRPVPTVAYMPVVGVDPCSGCAVTTYRPTTAWTYRASLLSYPAYRAGYAPVAVGAVSCAPCSSCSACSSCGGCAPCSGYSPSCGGCSSCGASGGGCSSCGTNYGGCSACGTTYSGCSSCDAGVSGGYVASGGCSSCASGSAPLSSTPLPGPGDMSQPPVLQSPSPATIGPPTAAPAMPAAPSEPARTYVPGAIGAPVSPSAPGARTSPSGASYRNPATGEGGRTVEPLRIDNIPSVLGPQLSPTPAPRPENENRTTASPVLQANYFQLLPSPPASVPAQLISAPAPAAAQRVDDSGWQHADN